MLREDLRLSLPERPCCREVVLREDLRLGQSERPLRRKRKRRKRGRSERHMLLGKRPSQESPLPSLISIRQVRARSFRWPCATRKRKSIANETRGEGGGGENIEADKEALEREYCLPWLGQRVPKHPRRMDWGWHACATHVPHPVPHFTKVKQHVPHS